MGLEMSLIKRTYVRHWNFLNDKSLVIETRNDEKTKIKPERVSHITEIIFEWDLANQLHNWFLNRLNEGEDNGEDLYVNTKDLEDLLDLCKRVNENNNLAEQLLPTLEGPYFGETDYDEYYFEVIETTITYLEDLLLELSEDQFVDGFSQLIYTSSW
jgi:homospermidine synthase